MNISYRKANIEDADLLEGDAFRSWLIDSYATLNQLQADRKLEQRISFEKIPSGNKYLEYFIYNDTGKQATITPSILSYSS